MVFKLKHFWWMPLGYYSKWESFGGICTKLFYVKTDMKISEYWMGLWNYEDKYIKWNFILSLSFLKMCIVYDGLILFN